MTLFTETMENQTEVEYISIYERPKRGKGRPRGSKYTEEEKLARHREANLRCYYNNHEYYKLHNRINNLETYHLKKKKKKKHN